MSDIAIVPVKSLFDAKRRLADHFDLDQRKKLVLAMLDDVLQALKQSRLFSEIRVVSPDVSLEAVVKRSQAVFMKQRGTGLNSAIRQAARALASMSADSMTTVLADLPLTVPKDFRELARVGRETRRIVLAPSMKGGTNVMLRSPPDVISTSYGRWSYAKHLRAGQKLGLPVYSISNSRLSFDVDTLQDFKALRRLDPSGRTHAGKLARDLDNHLPLAKNG